MTSVKNGVYARRQEVQFPECVIEASAQGLYFTQYLRYQQPSLLAGLDLKKIEIFDTKTKQKDPPSTKNLKRKKNNKKMQW